MTCLAVVGLGFPERFALGAAIGTPDEVIRAAAVTSDGILTATVSSPPVVTLGTTGLAGTTIVRGPGQKTSASFFMSSVISKVRCSKSSLDDMCTIMGLSEGLPFAA